MLPTPEMGATYIMMTEQTDDDFIAKVEQGIKREQYHLYGLVGQHASHRLYSQ